MTDAAYVADIDRNVTWPCSHVTSDPNPVPGYLLTYCGRLKEGEIHTRATSNIVDATIGTV